MAKNKYTARKFDGDDTYSWAVFRSADVKGKGMQIFYGEARPICSGMSRYTAQNEARRLSEKDNLN